MEKLTLGGVGLVALGSACGGVARWLLALWLPAGKLPWGTLAANVAGCFLIGALYGVLPERSSPWRLLLGVGFLGGFTTFSTLMHETLRLGPRTGGLNLFLSCALGGVALWLGARLGAALMR